MPQIYLEQLSPHTESITTLEIPNLSTSPAMGALEILHLEETRQSLSSYITVSISEQTDEPKTITQPLLLSTLAQQGYTPLSLIRPGGTKIYVLKFLVSKDIPMEFQKQKLTFDLNIGTEVQKASPMPNALVTRIENVATHPAVLGISKIEMPTQVSTNTIEPVNLHPIMLIFLTISLLTLILHILFHLVVRRKCFPK